MKNKSQAADPIPWDQLHMLIDGMIIENKPKIAALLAIGSYTLLRYSDIKTLKWEDTEKEKIYIKEQKTGKVRTITISENLRTIMRRILDGKNLTGPIFINKDGKPISTIYFNTELKRVKKNYQIDCENISTHSCRKTGARRIYDQSGQSEHSLIMLSQILKHSSIATTRIYLGLSKEEIAQCYLSL